MPPEQEKIRGADERDHSALLMKLKGKNYLRLGFPCFCVEADEQQFHQNELKKSTLCASMPPEKGDRASDETANLAKKKIASIQQSFCRRGEKKAVHSFSN